MYILSTREQCLLFCRNLLLRLQKRVHASEIVRHLATIIDTKSFSLHLLRAIVEIKVVQC